MDFAELVRSLAQAWENRPWMVVLGVVAIAGVVFLVIDAWRHKRHRKPPR